jgi:hypothetical protein
MTIHAIRSGNHKNKNKRRPKHQAVSMILQCSHTYHGQSLEEEALPTATTTAALETTPQCTIEHALPARMHDANYYHSNFITTFSHRYSRRIFIRTSYDILFLPGDTINSKQNSLSEK